MTGLRGAMERKCRLVACGLGFTLLEMLVTLVLVSLMGLLVSQALLQQARIERLLSGGRLHGATEFVRAEWVREALAGLQPGEVGSVERFAGDALSLQGVSSAVPRWPIAGLGPMRLTLRFDEKTGRTTLLLESGALGQDVLAANRQDAVALLSWEGRNGRWRYQDVAGEWHDRWPAPLGKAASGNLPVMVMLETGDADLGVLLAAPVASGIQMLTRRQMEVL